METKRKRNQIIGDILGLFFTVVISYMLGLEDNEFSIGMGPAIFHTTKGETEYSLPLTRCTESTWSLLLRCLCTIPLRRLSK